LGLGGSALGEPGLDAAGAGATVSVWYGKLGNPVQSNATTFTATLAQAVTAKALIGYSFSIGAGHYVDLGDGADRADDGADAGSLTLSNLPSRQYLFVRANAGEGTDPGLGATSGPPGWSTVPGIATSGGSAAPNIFAEFEFLIATATTATSDPSTAAVDQASVLVALIGRKNPRRRHGPDRHLTLAMPLARICTRCGGTYSGKRCESATCVAWWKLDDARRNARKKAHGRNTKDWTRFAEQVKRRDNYRCVECGTSRNLTVHYKLTGPHTSRNLDDYETRCRSCHGTIDAPRARRSPR
jgi:hypothetical protein